MDYAIVMPISLVLALAWAVSLYMMGHSKKDYSVQFYILLYAPLLIGFIVAITVGYLGAIAIDIGLIQLILLIIVFAIERFGWGITLRKVSGEERLAWFIIILVLPLFGWFLHWVTET